MHGRRHAGSGRARLGAVAVLLLARAVGGESRPVAFAGPQPDRRPLVVDAVGDSITAGYARSGDAQGQGAVMDPGGGYPKRLPSLLADGVEVRQRGLGGTTLETWIEAPRGDPAALEAMLRALWPDLPPHARPPRPRQSALSWTLDVDRPDFVILLLGVNDLWVDALHGGPPDARGAAERAARAAALARSKGARALVATLPPNERDASGAVEEFNRRLCELEPDCIRLDADFARAGGTALLGDEIHPSPEGHQAIARTMADALVRAGVARRNGAGPESVPAEPSGSGSPASGTSAIPSPAGPR